MSYHTLVLMLSNLVLLIMIFLGGFNVTEAGKSYRLIVYLDNAYEQNVIGDNFKIVVYNSNNNTILSEEPNIDFKDTHQKISPKNGYTLEDKSDQHPTQIKVCAQQSFEVNKQVYLHNDCSLIRENDDATYWYTIFEYGEIDGFEAEDLGPNDIPIQLAD